jgi:large subunit ribosomal protein L18
MQNKQEKRIRRCRRVRSRISGSALRPRLCVFRSAKHIYAQLIDDEKGKTLVSGSDKELKKKTPLKAKKNKEGEKSLSGKQVLAFDVGKLIAEKALKNKIEKVIFDRGRYKYHGKVKALAEGAREGGLKF